MARNLKSFLLLDTLAVTEVSRLGRTTAEVLLLADDLREREIHLRILNLGIDTATPAGGLVLTMMAGLAKFERQLLRERQRRGIDAARQRGKHLGRPRLLDASHAMMALRRLRAGDTLSAIAREWRVSGAESQARLPESRLQNINYCHLTGFSLSG
jgi:DNA invertase Pin-like site-specific DNA recombinase